MALDDKASSFEEIETDPVVAEQRLSPPVQPEGRRDMRRRLRLPLLLAAPVVALVAAFFLYLHGGRYETTDNAYFQSGLGQIAPDVSGRGIAVAVHESDRVPADVPLHAGLSVGVTVDTEHRRHLFGGS